MGMRHHFDPVGGDIKLSGLFADVADTLGYWNTEDPVVAFNYDQVDNIVNSMLFLEQERRDKHLEVPPMDRFRRCVLETWLIMNHRDYAEGITVDPIVFG